jgi:ATP-dependent DNA helicase RecG
MEIEKLIDQPESRTLEFKSDLSSLDPILKTLVAFANTAGGILIIGRLPTGEIVGVEDVFKAEEKLANAVADSIYPAILPEIEITTVHSKSLLVVKVAHWKGPFYLKKLGTPKGVYVRLGSTSRPAGPELIAEMRRSVLHLSFDEEAISDLAVDSLDVKKAELLLRTAGREIDEKKLRSLGVLVQSNHQIVPSVGGLILFGKQEDRYHFLPDARVSCARFKGDDKTDIIDRYDVEGTILDAVDEVPKFIMRNTRLSAEIRDMRRKDIPEYSPVALRETLVNAFVHCDYSITGSCIQIAIFNNRLEIQNPGMFPFGFTLEDFKSGVSRVRNRVLARVFSALNLMENWGSGYKRIVEACRAGGYPDPDWQELGSSIRVIFYPHAKTVLESQSQETQAIQQHLIPRQESLLSVFVVGECLPFRQIIQKLSSNISERSLRYDLLHLQSLGFLVAQGKGRALVWKRVR